MLVHKCDVCENELTMAYSFFVQPKNVTETPATIDLCKDCLAILGNTDNLSNAKTVQWLVVKAFKKTING